MPLSSMQHRETDYESAETDFDFTDANYELVRGLFDLCV